MNYWVVDYRQTKSGGMSPVVIGGRAFSSELLAQRYIDDADLSRKAEIFPLPTANAAKATSMIKAQLVKRYKSLDRGTTRATHTYKPIERSKEKEEPSHREELRKRLKGIINHRVSSRPKVSSSEPKSSSDGPNVQIAR